MTPTPEQAQIIATAKASNNSLLIKALAGAAKTTTLVMLAHALPLQAMLCIAFNKRISDEMQKRMPGHVQCKTINALGHGVWARTAGRLTVDSKKNYTLLKEEFDKLPKDAKGRLGDSFSSILRALALAKTSGYIPPSFRSIGTGLIEDREELLDVTAAQIDTDLEDEHLDLLDTVLSTSIQKAYKGFIDFDDQIYMPTLFGGAFPKFPLVMVDEAQDLSALNHETVKKLVGDRLIAVGDPLQSIYAFRGAHTESMEWLKEEFSMEELTLSVSFRCPRKIVELARWRAPHFKWFEGNTFEGEVTALAQWNQTVLPDGAAIICRNNAPLFACALKLIRQGRGVKLVGSELGPALIKNLRKLGEATMSQQDTHAAITKWENDNLAKARESRKAVIRDKAECLRVFADFGNTLSESIAYAEHLFAATGTISLLTGHKAKGLEWNDVFFLDPWRVPSRYAKESAEAGDDRQLQQELNLKYVIQTRAKKALYTMNLEDMT